MRIVVDLSNLAYICFYGLGYKNEESCNYDKDEFLEACHNKLFAIKAATNATEVIFAKDNLPKRKLLDENYKANRKDIIFPIKEDLINNLLDEGIKICEESEKEADDIMATLLKLKRIDCIVSTDQDLLQAIEDGNQLFNPITMSFWNKEKLETKYHGLKEYNKVLLYKSFFGDKSDNIEKVGDRLPKKVIVEKLNEYNDLEKIYESLSNEKFFNKIDKKRLYLNYDLVKLNMKCKPTLIKRNEI